MQHGSDNVARDSHAPASGAANRAAAADGGAERPDDRFIPIRYPVLAERLAADLVPPGEREAFSRLAVDIARILAAEARYFADHVIGNYVPFNPDRDTLLTDRDAPSTDDAYRRLRRQVEYMFDKANFERIDQEEFRRAIAAANTQGLALRLDADVLEDVELFFRGRATATRDFRRMRNLFRERAEPVPIYRRLALLIRPRGSNRLVIKLFKDIPQVDIEALLPRARVQMTLKDRVAVAASGMTAIGSAAIKVAKIGLLATSRLLWVLAIAAGAAAGKTFFGFRRVRDKRNVIMTRNLYSHALANNAAVLHTIMDKVAHEEAKEALLAYALATHGDRALSTPAELDRAVEAYLRDRYATHVDFEFDDAVETVRRLRLWAHEPAVRTIPLPEALRRLEEHAHARLTLTYHLDRAAEGRKGVGSL